MNFLLIGGQQNTGKSETIYRLANKILSSFTLINGSIPSSFDDFTALLNGVDTTGKKVKILFHSASDDMDCINRLKKHINTHKPDIIVTSIRDIGWERTEVEKIVSSNYFFEIPLARITRRHHHRGLSRLWYHKNVDNIVKLVVESLPFNL